MLDFTSSLYLGLKHPHSSLRPWKMISTGAPAALRIPALNRTVAAKLALLFGCESAILASSTLHLFWDLFTIFKEKHIAIYLDAGTYPIARWGVERAAAKGVPIRLFLHYDPNSLAKKLIYGGLQGFRPIIIADGFCPGCGRPAPVGDYLKIARRNGGHLVLDDTQALGILGSAPDADVPCGRGGGGILRWSGISGPEIILASSMAKGFGVPIAVLSGSYDIIRRYRQKSETRIYCSPPSIAFTHAAEHALEMNSKNGDVIRYRLSKLIKRFRKNLKEAKLTTTSLFFPIQTLKCIQDLNAMTIYDELFQRDIHSVLHGSTAAHGRRLSFLINAFHQPWQIDQATDALINIIQRETIKYRIGATL